MVMMKPPEFPLHAIRPAIGLLKAALIGPSYPPVTKLPPAVRMSAKVAPPSRLISSTPPSKKGPLGRSAL